MVYYKTREEIELLRESSLLVSKTLAEIAKVIKPGMTLIEIDALAESFIRDHGAVPAFKNYKGFPNTLCMSLNEAVVHGIPSKHELTETDLISVDCGVKLNGYFGDSAYTFVMPGASEEVVNLCRATKTSLFLGIEQGRVGNRMGDIGYAIQNYTETENGYGVVRELVGHGVGRNLHEDPEVPNYGKRGSGMKLQEGLVIAIEPMVNLGVRNVVQLQDGWTIVTGDKKPSAHYELMIAIGKQKADVLSTFSYIEEASALNNNVIDIDTFKQDLVSTK